MQEHVRINNSSWTKWTSRISFSCFLCITLFISTSGQSLHPPVQDSIALTYPNFRQTYIPSYSLIKKNKTLTIPQPIQNWGAVCKLEFQLEQKIKIPVKFRLGTLEYVDKLEGKQ